MSTVMPQNELLRKAVEWISEEKQGGGKLKVLIQDAAMRFNLGPKDMQFLENFFENEKNAGNE